MREAVVGLAADKGISVDAAAAAVFIIVQKIEEQRTARKVLFGGIVFSSFGDLAKTGKSVWSALDVAERSCPNPFAINKPYGKMLSFCSR